MQVVTRSYKFYGAEGSSVTAVKASTSARNRQQGVFAPLRVLPGYSKSLIKVCKGLPDLHSSWAIVPPPESAAQAPSQQGCAADGASISAENSAAFAALKALGQYTPTGLADGPASLSQVLPYNAAEYQYALQHGMQLLKTFNTYKLANIAAAIAAAGHVDPPFMTHLGREATRQLKAGPTAQDNATAVAQLQALSYLAVAYARLGMQHTDLMTQIAATGTKLLRRGSLRPSKRSHAKYLALMAAAFAALQLYPPQLFRAMGELLRQQRAVISLLGPQESMLMLWAFAKVGHVDPFVQLLLTERAATQVGQLDCKGLAHAYMQCAQAGLTAPPLLAALRKATRQRLHAMSPEDLTALLLALAAMGQQDCLLLDEVAKAVHNKLMNFTAAQISSAISACSLLSYRNSWLLDHASKVLVSRKLNKAAQLSPTELDDLLSACKQLGYHNERLFSHLKLVATEWQLTDSPGQHVS